MNKVHYNLYLYDQYLDLLEKFFLNQKLPASILFIGNEGVGKKVLLEISFKNKRHTKKFTKNKWSLKQSSEC